MYPGKKTSCWQKVWILPPIWNENLILSVVTVTFRSDVYGATNCEHISHLSISLTSIKLNLIKILQKMINSTIHKLQYWQLYFGNKTSTFWTLDGPCSSNDFLLGLNSSDKWTDRGCKKAVPSANAWVCGARGWDAMEYQNGLKMGANIDICAE